MLLPGENLKFEYFYDCPIIVKTETVYRVGTSEGVSRSVRNEMVPFQRVSYYFEFSENAAGVCYSSSGEKLKKTTSDVDAVIPVNRGLLKSAVCANKATTCTTAGGQSGSCHYVDIEPRRLFSSRVSSIRSIHNQMVIKRIIAISIMDIHDNPGDGEGN